MCCDGIKYMRTIREVILDIPSCHAFPNSGISDVTQAAKLDHSAIQSNANSDSNSNSNFSLPSLSTDESLSIFYDKPIVSTLKKSVPMVESRQQEPEKITNFSKKQLSKRFTFFGCCCVCYTGVASQVVSQEQPGTHSEGIFPF